MIPLFGDSMAAGRRWALEGRLISLALQALRQGVSVVLDYGGSGAAMNAPRCAIWPHRPAPHAAVAWRLAQRFQWVALLT